MNSLIRLFKSLMGRTLPHLLRTSHRGGSSDPEQQPEDKSWWQRGVDMWKSAGAGIAKAGLETKDFIFGEPAEEDKSNFRKQFEQRSKELADDSMANSLTMGVSQIVTGLIGAGKVMAPVKAAKWFQAGGKAAQAGFEVARGATAGAVVLDPHEERLSNLVETFPDLQNPVTEYLAAKPDDSAAEGRFKNALESIGADFALMGAVKAIKFLRAGDQVAADKEIAKLANPEGEYKNYHDAATKDRTVVGQQDEFGLNIEQTQKEMPLERSDNGLLTVLIIQQQQRRQRNGCWRKPKGGRSNRRRSHRQSNIWLFQTTRTRW